MHFHVRNHENTNNQYNFQLETKLLVFSCMFPFFISSCPRHFLHPRCFAHCALSRWPSEKRRLRPWRCSLPPLWWHPAKCRWTENAAAAGVQRRVSERINEGKAFHFVNKGRLQKKGINKAPSEKDLHYLRREKTWAWLTWLSQVKSNEKPIASGLDRGGRTKNIYYDVWVREGGLTLVSMDCSTIHLQEVVSLFFWDKCSLSGDFFQHKLNALVPAKPMRPLRRNRWCQL